MNSAAKYENETIFTVCNRITQFVDQGSWGHVWHRKGQFIYCRHKSDVEEWTAGQEDTVPKILHYRKSIRPPILTKAPAVPDEL